MKHPWCWVYRNYIFLTIILILVYLTGAFLAPIFQNSGFQSPADLLYRFYSSTCHQFAFRSWFLYGKQPFYALERAGIQNLDTYEQISGKSPTDLDAARQFTGNAEAGYKVALCQRDVAIFSGLMLAALGFLIWKRKWQPISVFMWIILGVLPIFLDGISQLGGSSFPFFAFLPARESYPFMRTSTGLLFGVTTGLYLFPKMENLLKIIKINHQCEDR